MKTHLIRPFFGWLVCWQMSASALAGDWGEILGPNRNGIAVNEQLGSTWPAMLARKWEFPVGDGFAGPAVAQDRCYIFHRQGRRSTLVSLNVATGQPVWARTFATSFEPQIVDDTGPRCVPTVHGDFVLVFQADGELSAVRTETGEVAWTRQIGQDYKASSGYFGHGSAPLIHEGKVIVNVGGDRQKASVVALELATGQPLWTVGNQEASYAAPTLVQLENERVVLVLTRLKLMAIDPSQGTILWETPFGQRGPTVNGAIPIFTAGDKVLLTASYGIGAQLLSIDRKQTRMLWESEVLSSQYTTPIVRDGVVWGVNGRQDGGKAELVCFELETQKVRWKQSLSDYATLIAAGDSLLIQQTNGLLVVADWSADKFTKRAEYRLSSATCRPLPALANGHYYLRDRTKLFCFELPK